MTLAFDTAALVASLVPAHPHHPACWPWFVAVKSKKHEGAICLHSIAELYATLTVLPMRPRPTLAEVVQIMDESVVPHFRTVELTRRDYQKALTVVSSRLLPSGAIYDALIEVAARKAKARHLVTLNVAHFKRFSDDENWLLDPRTRQP